jgi:hypothetical protein
VTAYWIISGVVDERDRPDGVLSLVLVAVVLGRFVEDDPHGLRPGLNGVVYDFASCAGRGAVVACPLRLHGLAAAEERELVRLRQT